MQLKNSATQYGLVSKSLHGLLIVLVIAMLICGNVMDLVPKSFRAELYNWHKLTGLLVFITMAIFLFWSLINPKPEYPTEIPKLQRLAARIVHCLLYFCLLAMPMVGLIMSTAAGHLPNVFGLFSVSFPGIPVDKSLVELFSDLHATLGWVIVGILSLHVLGALKHHFINKDNILKRMFV